jgi:CDP-diacylglycerol---serine O-phosphatidyltransferase
VSRLPVYSGKRIGTRVPPEMVGPVIILLVLFVALLIAYPWIILTIGTLCYLASLPLGWVSYKAYEQRAREGRAEAPTGAASAPNATSRIKLSEDEERPSRLN